MRSWFITRYDDITKYLQGDTFITSPLIWHKMKNLPEGEDKHFKEIIDIISTWMIYNDRPIHTRLRKYMNRAFWKEEIEAITPEIKKIVTSVLDQVVEKHSNEFDFVSEVAHPIPALVLCKMLGIPGEEVKRFIRWSDDIAQFMQNFVVSHVPDKDISDQTKKSMKEMYMFLSEAIAERRIKKRNDLLSRLISDNPGEEGELCDDELIAQTIHLIFGGHKIPQFMLSNTLHLLFKHPKVFDELKKDLSLIPKVLDEAMRLEGPIQYITRHAAQDITIHNQLIREGDSVYFFLGSAGRDERVFENPEKFDINRTGKQHIGFGGGYHACIAAAFARVEIAEILKEVIQRFSHITPLYNLERPEWTPNPTFHGIVTMPIKY
ncbi:MULTISPECIES: cytochrome P450 [Anoxybacillus]|nr:cytochrome P450 [Anoxybacillus flavithermus]OAO77290.1 putative cytochrome P450 hydroxylase [Anoxybacillus flavithermus]